ncbi:MAG TPA: hypothetical protein VGO39_12510 [Gaiellaceae bacterium]|nr:hypothetical protein [Gaiellaceae bacterium]
MLAAVAALAELDTPSPEDAAAFARSSRDKGRVLDYGRPCVFHRAYQVEERLVRGNKATFVGWQGKVHGVSVEISSSGEVAFRAGRDISLDLLISEGFVNYSRGIDMSSMAAPNMLEGLLHVIATNIAMLER